LAFDHVVERQAAVRTDVRRPTLGEEHDATGHKPATLLNRKVSAQVEVNSSCSPHCAANNPKQSTGLKRKGHASFDPDIELVSIRNPSLKTKM
jgi:hypothetical protein